MPNVEKRNMMQPEPMRMHTEHRKTMDAAINSMEPTLRRKMQNMQNEMSVVAGRISALNMDIKTQTAKLRESALAQQIALNKRKLARLQALFNNLVQTFNGLFDLVTDKDQSFTTNERWEMIFNEMDEEAKLLGEDLAPRKGVRR